MSILESFASSVGVGLFNISAMTDVSVGKLFSTISEVRQRICDQLG